nr:hypothetical protein [Paracoccus versutus]
MPKRVYDIVGRWSIRHQAINSGEGNYREYGRLSHLAAVCENRNFLGMFDHGLSHFCFPFIEIENAADLETANRKHHMLSPEISNLPEGGSSQHFLCIRHKFATKHVNLMAEIAHGPEDGGNPQ